MNDCEKTIGCRTATFGAPWSSRSVVLLKELLAEEEVFHELFHELPKDPSRDAIGEEELFAIMGRSTLCPRSDDEDGLLADRESDNNRRTTPEGGSTQFFLPQVVFGAGIL